MKISSLTITVCAMALISALPAHAGWRETGTGGDHIAKDFVESGYEALRLLKAMQGTNANLAAIDAGQFEKTLATAQVHSLPTTKVFSQALQTFVEKEAVNYPAVQPAEIVVNQNLWPKLAQQDKTTIAFHEVVSLMGKEAGTYPVSQAFDEGIKSYDPQPVLVFDSTRDSGEMSYRDAWNLCARWKAISEQKYWISYCQIESQELQRYIEGVIHEPVTEVLGYQVDEEYDRFGVLIRTHESPVLRTVWLSRVDVVAIENYRVATVKVFGLGDLSLAAWKTVVDSRKFGDGEVEMTFSSRGEAYMSCTEILVARRSDPTEPADSLKFYRAKCAATPTADGRFAFEIQSQNPWLP